MDYGFKHEGKVFTPNKTHVEDVEAHNAALEKQELEAWRLVPEQFAVYVNEANRTVTTWRGVLLGTITEWTQFRTNISRNIVAIRFRGTNGARYYGRYGADWSQLCRVRKAKG